MSGDILRSSGGTITASTPTPSSVDIADSGSVGTSEYLAKADHEHAVTAPSSGYPLDVATAEADGTATTPARSDHVHALANSVVATAKIADEAVTSRKLAPTIIEDPSTGTTTINSGTPIDITGVSISVTPDIASVALILGRFSCVSASGTDPYTLIVDVDGTDTTLAQYHPTASGGDRKSISGFCVVALTAAAHTIKLQASRDSGTGSATVESATLIVLILGDANATP